MHNSIINNIYNINVNIKYNLLQIKYTDANNNI